MITSRTSRTSKDWFATRPTEATKLTFHCIVSGWDPDIHVIHQVLRNDFDYPFSSQTLHRDIQRQEEAFNTLLTDEERVVMTRLASEWQDNILSQIFGD